MRKFGSASEAAFSRVKHFHRGLDDGVNYSGRELPTFSCKRFCARNSALDHLGLLHHVVILFVVGIRDGEQHSLETRTPVMIVRRKICSTVEGLAVGGEKCSQWPAALSANRTDCDLIATVNVGTFITIDLHCDETLVDDVCNFGIVVRLAVHHVAPVTPHCANVEQDGLVLALGDGKGLLAPLVPLDRLVHGGTQVGGRRLGQGVEGGGGHGLPSL